jgi:hypothetical protein
MPDHDAALKLLREIRDGKHSLPGTLVQIDRLFAKAEPPPTGERAMRFVYLLSEIEVRAQRLLRGQERDILLTLLEMKVELEEATEIAQEVSREALDRVTPKE